MQRPVFRCIHIELAPLYAKTCQRSSCCTTTFIQACSSRIARRTVLEYRHPDGKPLCTRANSLGPSSSAGHLSLCSVHCLTTPHSFSLAELAPTQASKPTTTLETILHLTHSFFPLRPTPTSSQPESHEPGYRASALLVWHCTLVSVPATRIGQVAKEGQSHYTNHLPIALLRFAPILPVYFSRDYEEIYRQCSK
jgi:hypothetical protein